MKKFPALVAVIATLASGGAEAYQAPWIVYCTTYWNENLPCNYLTWQGSGGFKTPKPVNPPITAPAVSNAPQWGTTDATVFAAFGPTILAHFKTNPLINAQITNMNWTMLARLSTELAAHDASNLYRPQIYTVAAQKLTAPALAWMRSAFGSVLDIYIADYAPAAVYTAYLRITPYPPLYLSTNWWLTKKLAPEVFPSTMSYYDILLNQYTLAGDTTQSALHKTMIYTQRRQKAGVVEVVGTVGAVLGIIQFFDPNAWADIKQISNDWYVAIKGAYPIVWPLPVTSPPDGSVGGGYPGGLPPPIMPVPDTTGGVPGDPNTSYFPMYNFPGEEGWAYCGIGIDLDPC